ncbi:MAG: MMPL family transporter [Oscillospiraceae bacterium]|nr:MMPL family transporter [Oscillospiraceae bacterium]
MLLFILATLASAFFVFFVRVNNDMTRYLPAESESTIGLALMGEAFGGGSDAGLVQVMIPSANVKEALLHKETLRGIGGVEAVSWLDDEADIFTPIEFLDTSITERYLKDGYALYQLSVIPAQASYIMREIDAAFGGNASVSGAAFSDAQIMSMTNRETQNTVMILLPVMLFILIIATRSIVEPLAILAALGVAVVINMGTNYFLGEISFITNTVSPILQLAITLDYALFLLSSFKRQRLSSPSPLEAMKAAVSESFVSVAGSAATTLFGFAALMFMRFGIGFDLGLNLLKGILISFASVVVFLPCLVLMLNRFIKNPIERELAVETGEHKKSVFFRNRWAIMLVLVIVSVPAYIAQSRNQFTYSTTSVNEAEDSARDQVTKAAVFGDDRANVLLIPSGNPAKENALIDSLQSLPEVSRITSYASTVGKTIPTLMLEPSQLSQLTSNGLSRIILYNSTPYESAEAFRLVEQIRELAHDAYPDESYLVGTDANLFDIMNVIESDAKLINMIAILAIIFVLLLAFRSVSLPLLLVFTIEAAIWINMAVPYFTASPLNYIGYLVVSTVQLGATVDYAILLTDHYRRNRRSHDRVESIRRAVGSSKYSILISSAILATAGLSLFFASQNSIVVEMGMLLARGTVLSALMVVLALPALLTVFDKVIEKTSLKNKPAAEVIDEK